MKVLLINPPIKNIIKLEMPGLIRQNEGFFPPLGLMYIAAYLKKYVSCQVQVLDALALKMDYDEIGEYVREFCPDIAGITVHTHNLIDAISVTDVIKKNYNRIHVCWGGPHVNIFPREAIDMPRVDSVVMGEGEETFAELVKCIGGQGKLEDVGGIFFKRSNEVVQSQERSGAVDLDRLPFPDRTQVDASKYSSILSGNSLTTTIASSRGCPYGCAFCSTPKASYRMRSANNVVDEMEECVKLGINELHFIDDTFNADLERVVKICDELERRKLNVRWSLRGRVDKVSASVLKKLKQAGCYRIHFGVEASTDDGLKRLKKGIKLEQVRNAFKLARENKIETVAYFLIGGPHEKNREDVNHTVNFSKEINPDFALFNILTLYPKTELYQESLDRGMLKTDCWEEFARAPKKSFQPPLWSEWLPQEELYSILNMAYRKFYLRPNIILKALSASKDLRTLARRIKAGLGILKLH